LLNKFNNKLSTIENDLRKENNFMRYFLFLLILFFTLNATDIDKYNIINSFKVSQNEKDYKNITYEEYKTKQVKNISIKLGINKNNLKNKTFYLSIVSENDSLIYTNVNYKIKDHMLIVKLDDKIVKNLYFNYEYKTKNRIQFRFNIISEFEYKYILPYEGILYGFAYGIILSAFIYYLVIYFSTRRIYFLYYSIMQLFVLLSLIGFMYFSFKIYPSYWGQAIVDAFETSSFLFTFLFAKEILNTKKNMPYMNFILNLFIVLNLLDLIAIIIFKYSILYEVMNFYICFLLTSICGVIAFFKGNKNAIFYSLGWLLLFCFIISYEYDLIPLSGIYTIHMAAPLESLIFSFALAYMLKQLIKKQNEQEKMLIHKSKLASMGEMINNIAHQWRQPLMHLGYINMNLEMSSQSNEYEKDYFIQKIRESNSQIKFMSKTIDDFSDFYQIEKEKQDFSLSNACNLAINIISSTLKKKRIKIHLDVQEDSIIKAYENEYAQVILNFLTNSVDVLVSRKIKNPTINIEINVIDNISITKVSDNAGGIEDKYLDEIFQAYFTTKERGSGIGLYMSQIIIKSHFKGNIKVYNNKEGACFSIEI